MNTREKHLPSICFLGDVCGTGGIDEGCLEGILRALDQDVLLVGNIECCLSVRGTPTEPKYACLRESPLRCTGLRALDVAVLANNHISDFGHEAALDTIESLQQMGLQTLGYGLNLKESLMPVIIEQGGVKIGLLSFSCPTTNGWNSATPVTPGVPPLAMPLVHEQILALRPKADALFVYVHWGVERCYYPVPDQIRVARQMIDWGADAVIGTHAHVIQPYERYKHGYIFYGLGNAVFSDVEYRKWDIEGQSSRGVLRQHRENLESLAPVFRIAVGAGQRVVLERILALRFDCGQLTPINSSELFINLEDLNWRFRFYAQVRKKRLTEKAEIKAVLRHNGGYYYCDYLERPISSDRMWAIYDRLDRKFRGRLEILLKWFFQIHS